MLIAFAATYVGEGFFLLRHIYALFEYSPVKNFIIIDTVAMLTDEINFMIIARVIYLSSRTISHHKDVSLLSYLQE